MSAYDAGIGYFQLYGIGGNTEITAYTSCRLRINNPIIVFGYLAADANACTFKPGFAVLAVKQAKDLFGGIIAEANAIIGYINLQIQCGFLQCMAVDL